MSGGDDSMPGRRRRGRPAALTPTERALWEHVARSIRPMPPSTARVPDIEIEPATHAEGQRVAASKPAPVATPEKKSRGAKSTATVEANSDRLSPRAVGKSGGWSMQQPAAPVLPTLDRRQARRIKAGNTPIDARIDLHGLTQSLAHDRLIGFIRSSAAAGFKIVLVITGKGAPRAKGNLGHWADSTEEPGVLRRNVPRWLAEAPVRGFVVSCQPASARHGGEGAFYVTLRRGPAKA